MKFSDLILHPAVASALATRGYEMATPVQAAVLDARCADRDLVVSSQTGSGKTVAFGAALVQTLLGTGATVGDGTETESTVPPTGAATLRSARGVSGAHPLALVVVPTRELAIQVRDELGWLLKQTGLKMASFTGGTAVSGDLRALQKGVDLVIGTPGRLCDLLRRQRLDLTGIRVVILDEADEMLDLGFREDLQTLLQAAPDTRRTLMLSATLPPEIRALARRFQRDALPIDPRKDAGAVAPAPHDDITYVAHLISSADRLAVVVNVLRNAGTGRAILFCTTREGVSRLHAALVARGFAATAISGDRAQAERDRALDLLRRGDARVLVATNVAARGLHLPDVDLIVHADLPLNADSLTHRSGRTARAGRKGTAVVIASVSERRKAERLLMSAHVPVVWTPPPSADSITAAARDRLAQDLLRDETDTSDNASDNDNDNDNDSTTPQITSAVEELARRLEEKLPAARLLRRLLMREVSRLPVGERVQSVAVPPTGSARMGRFDDHDEPSGRPRGRGDFNRDGVLFRVNIGAREKADPRWLLPLICRRGGVTRREVGAIRIGPTDTMFEIAGEAARDFALAASEADPRAPHVTIKRAQSEGGDPSARSRESTESKPWQRPTARTAAPQRELSPAPQYARPAPAKTTPAHASAQAAHPPAHLAHPPARPAQKPARPPAPSPQAPRPHKAPPQTTRPEVAPAQTTEAQSSKGRPSSNMGTLKGFPSPPAMGPVERSSPGPHTTGSPATGPTVTSRRGDGPGRPIAQIPVIEMKRARRVENRPRNAKQDGHQAGGPRNARDDDHARAVRPDRQQAGESRHARDDGRARTGHPHRPRMDGTDPARRTSAPAPPPPLIPARAPFWKDGARRRPAAVAHGPDSPVRKHKGR